MSKATRLRSERARLFDGIGVPEAAKFIVDDFQQEAIFHCTAGDDTLVVAPTGSGKTYIAFEAIQAFLLQNLRSVYTTPLKALSNTKFNELKLRFGKEHSVGLLTGDRKIDTDSKVVVATTEIYRNELYKSSERYSLVVLDEIHFIADPQRGPVWEESIILTPSSSVLLMLSASISNPREIADWIENVRGKPCRVVQKKDRPVPLRYGFLHPEHGVLPLSDAKGRLIGEVSTYYAGSRLDDSGRRLRSKGFRPKRFGRRGR